MLRASIVAGALCCGCGASATAAIIGDDLPADMDLPDDAERHELSAQSTQVEVDINGMVSYTLSFPDVTGVLLLAPEALEDSRAMLTVNMRTAKTDNEELGRIAKSKDFLDVERYPKALFEIRSLDKKGGAGEFAMLGVLELHGQRKSITVPFGLHLEPCIIRGTTEFSINRRHFGVQSDTTLDSMASDEVDIRVRMDVPRTREGCHPSE